MSQKIKHFIVASAAVLAIGGAGAATVTTSVQARGGGHDDHHQHGDQSQNTWRIIHFIKEHFNEIKQGGPLLHEHASLVTPYLKAQLLAEPDEAALAAAVDANSQQIATIVGKVYPGSHDTFLSQWRQHIQYYTDYLNASKTNDTSAKELAKQNLQALNTAIATTLDNASQKLDKNKLAAQLQTHTDGTLMVIDAMVAGDWTKVYTQSHMGYEHMTEISITLLMGAKLKG